MKSSSHWKFCLGASAIAMLTLSPAQGQVSTASSRVGQAAVSPSETPIAICKAEDYVLEVWHVGEADPERYAHDIAIFFDVTANMNEPKTFKDKQVGPQGGAEVGGSTVTGGGGGGGGGGGAFHPPKKVLGIRVLDSKSRKVVKQAVFGAGYEVLEADGNQSASTLPEMFRTRYFWPKDAEPSPPSKFKWEDLTPLH
jgi:hypothetical protein